MTSALALAAAGCGSGEVVAIAPGRWGGRNVDLIVDDAGATLAFRCGAKGTIDAALRLDASARFDLSGTYDPVLVMGGPRAARYVGSLSGDAMTRDVRVADTAIGTFRLTRGTAGTFDVCNF